MLIFRNAALLSICFLAMLTGKAAAVVPLFDFEDPSQVAAWTKRTSQQDKLVRTDRFATSGRYSMQFISPPFRTGLPGWPAFDTKPAVKDWREFDRLLIDVANPSSECAEFYVIVRNDKTGQMQKPIHLLRRGFTRAVLPLSEVPGDRASISLIQFFSVAPKDMRVCIDNITLLKPDEPLPPVPASTGKQIAAMKMTAVRDAIVRLESVKASAAELCSNPISLRIADSRLDSVEEKLQAMKMKLASFSGNPDTIQALEQELDVLFRTRDRVYSEVHFAAACKDHETSDNGMLVGFASSMEKILPKDMPFKLSVSRRVDISLARNEKESFQIAVMPSSARLRKVKVSVSDLKGPNGTVFPTANINCDVVGYVKTVNPPPYDANYVGWWPDPILDFIPSVDIAPGDMQTFWVRVRASKEQSPGLYRGKLTVSAEGKEPAVFDINVKVRSFTMPDCTPMPTALSFHAPEMVKRMQNEICGGPENWAKMKYVYADFLADYYMDYDHLYLTGVPDFDVLKYRHDKGTLTAFNFSYFGADSAANIANCKPAYEKAKELGILDHAYIYGFDECGDSHFPALEKSAADLKKAFPEVPIITTALDRTYGQETVAKSIDAWCPLTTVYSVSTENADKARKAGKKVWWYIACIPGHPFANWWVEYPAIDARLLMGAMATKFRPDGFLYYALALWWNNNPITSGPYTNWDPVSWKIYTGNGLYTYYHGDGSLLCAGPGGKPLPTIRLENYRDGMEDYAYSKILEEIIRRYEALGRDLKPEQARWLKRAKDTLPVPGTLVNSLQEYSQDPKELYKYREHISDLIDTSGMPDADPWGKDFGPRGFQDH